MVDYLAGGFDAVVRYNGGSNAGHTVVLGGKKHTFHLVPSGALKGKELLIGAGVAVDPVILREEISLLPDGAKGRMMVDGMCSLVSPMDKGFDAMLEDTRGVSAIGTTRRGIGPSYALRALRLTPRISDLLAGYDFAAVFRFYQKLGLETTGIVEWAEDAKRLLADLAGDVGSRATAISEKGGSVLFEGSQGFLLDLLQGTYPFVTATHTSASYVPASLGIAPSLSGKPLGVAKCYTTRVGSGPFPSEIGGALAESIRSTGNEYGSTTGRPRRVGWLDLVALKYAIRLNGAEEIAVSKLDVLSKVKDFKVCTAYRFQGSETSDFRGVLSRLHEVEPIFESPVSLYGESFADGIPKEARALVDYIEDNLEVRVRLLSYGEERSQTVEL